MLPAVLILMTLPFIALCYIVYGMWVGGEWLVKWFIERNERRRIRIEAELDRKQEELRRTIWQLASELSADAHETRKAMIRASFEATQEERD